MDTKGLIDAEASTEDTTPDPAKLADRAMRPASLTSVDEAFRAHIRHCPALKWIRQAAIIIAFILGVLATVQVIAVLAGKAVIREAVRDAVRAEIGYRSPMPHAAEMSLITSARAETSK